MQQKQTIEISIEVIGSISQEQDKEDPKRNADFNNTTIRILKLTGKIAQERKN